MESGVTIITCTKKPQFIDNIFKNFARQKWFKKELIIILNRDDMDIQHYQRRAKNYRQVKVFKLSEKKTLGACLNFAIERAAYPFIAKFDDDDFYGSAYIQNSMQTMRRTKADIVGKRAYYTYVEFQHMLLLRFPGGENKFSKLVAGATILMKKRVWNKIRFANRTLGEDVTFLQKATANGFKIYSGSKQDYICIRRQNPRLHTWIPKLNYLLKTAKITGNDMKFYYLIREFTK